MPKEKSQPGRIHKTMLFLKKKYIMYISCNRQLEFKPVQLKASYFSRGVMYFPLKPRKTSEMVSGFLSVKAPVVAKQNAQPAAAVRHGKGAA